MTRIPFDAQVIDECVKCNYCFYYENNNTFYCIYGGLCCVVEDILEEAKI